MSDEMSGFQCYETWNAVNAHFKGRYDFFKYRGKMRTKPESYEARKDKYIFEKASRRFKRDDFIKYIVALITDRSTENGWLGDMLNAKNEIAYKKWKMKIESMSYIFKEEMQYLSEKEEKFDNLLVYRDGKHPLIFRLYQRGKVSLETLIIIDDLVHFTKYWSGKNDIIMDDVVELIHKYRPFLYHFTDASSDKWKQIILETFND
jgi:hypothetical protein